MVTEGLAKLPAPGAAKAMVRRSALSIPLILVLSLASSRSAAAASVEVKGYQLLVDGAPLHLKGVCWNPVPRGGTHPKDLDFRGFVASDAALMAQAGINAVRTYEPIVDLEVLDALWERKIYVLNTVYTFGKDPVDTLVERVNKVKHHPAILMWVIGNEWNYNGMYIGLPFESARDLVRQAVDLIKQNDKDHPVSTIHGEIPEPETLEVLSGVDVWGINKYSGIDFGSLFDDWGKISSKPMYLGEYGADVYDSKHKRLDEADQAMATTVLSGQITQASSVNGGVCIGGIIFELADELWKDISGSPSVHDVGGVSPGSGPFPDFTFNEEWWGLLQYNGTPRKAYEAYKQVVIPGASAEPLDAFVGEDANGVLLRQKVCGAHLSCKGRIGFCCPGDDGVFDPCCHVATTAAPSKAPASQTTWRPTVGPQIPTVPGTTCHRTSFEERFGSFANGHFEVGSLGCHGVGECQFSTRSHAQDFCDLQPRCTAVLQFPFADNCAGSFGCFTPRFGELAQNNLWERSGGKIWAKVTKSCKDEDDGRIDEYAFIGFYTGLEAQSACKDIGELPMPKTPGQRRTLVKALDAMQAAGKLSDQWPKDTIWLGGHYNPTDSTWMWKDNTQMQDSSWGDDRPSAAGKNQMTKPWLCMTLDGHMQDTDPPYQFGVLCKLHKASATGQAQRRALAGKVTADAAEVAAPHSAASGLRGGAVAGELVDLVYS